MYACVYETGSGFFVGGVHTQQCNRQFPRPTPTPRFANCSVPALQQVEHGVYIRAFCF
jgi:hypothetical protein